MSTSTPAPLTDESDVSDLEAAYESDLFRPLTGNDRCDRDQGEQAVAQVLVGSTVLLFCGHHWRENETELSKFPHDVPDDESKPMTHRRAAELGNKASQERLTGDDHA